MACDSTAVIEPYSSQDLKRMPPKEDLSCLDLLRLASSVSLLDSIFMVGDVSIEVLTEEFSLGVSHPVVVVDGRKDFHKWITDSEIEVLRNLRSSKQVSVPLTNSLAAYLADYESTVGAEASFLLKLHEGKIVMNSKNRY